jgi:hypothetical protein
MRNPIFKARQLNRRQRSRHPLAHLLRPQPELERAKRYILPHRRRKQLVIRVLEQQAYASPDLQQMGRYQRLASDPNAALLRRRAQDAVQVQQQRGFARAIGSNQAYRLGGSHLKGNIPKRNAPVRIGILQMLDDNHSRIFIR